MRTLARLSDLGGRVALVVGGAGHLGRAACDVLSELGAQVAVGDVTPHPDQDAALQLKADLNSESETRRLVESTVDALGRLDILVHAAAFTGQSTAAGWARPLEEQTVEAFNEAHQVNVTSAFALAQEAQPHLSRHGTGSIVLIASMYGMIAPDHRLYQGTSMASPTGYSTSKAAMIQLGRHLATAFAPSVRVNAISPGGVFRNQDPRFVRRYEASTPLARMATEEDIKGAVAYLASDQSSYVTGANLVLDGGRSIW